MVSSKFWIEKKGEKNIRREKTDGRPSLQVLVLIQHLHILIVLDGVLLTLSIHLRHRSPQLGRRSTSLQSSSVRPSVR